jgi:DNA-binding PadR family transcriptional regulator
VIEDLDWGLIPLYILHRAAIEPIDSLGIVEKLHLHGLKFGTESVSRILRGLEGKGYLEAASLPKDRQSYRIYRMTSRGRLVAKQARMKVHELLAGLTT